MSKSRTNKFIDTIDECLTNGVRNGIFQVSLEDNDLNGRTVTINGRNVVNFGSCSYLGLEVDERLKQGAIDAALRYGTQYSSSRLFSACNLYEEIEDLFEKIFGHPSILAATTTLAHVGAIPILVQDEDLVILDHQVHGSVQLAVQLVKARGTAVDMIKHNRMDMLEDRIRENPNKYNKIWYMADGLYSMYGDFAPLKEITELLDRYPNFYVYIDDAHGMSWTGKHGSGYVLSQMELHPKMVLTTSLAKGFGTGGGVTILRDPEMRRKILTCGSSYTFSGPVQPPMLGASIASAKIHLSDEIYTLQAQLREKIEHAAKIIGNYELPLVLPSASPIFYIGLGLPRVGYNMVRRLLNEGYYTNIGIFPGVPVKCCGLRLAVTNGQTKDDIQGVLDAFRYHFPRVLEEEGQTVEDICNNFNMSFEQTQKRYGVPIRPAEDESLFHIQHETTIHRIDQALWDELLGDNGTFDWEGCRFIQNTFQGNPEPENNWDMHYVIITDRATQKPVLATFFSVLMCKDDMIAPENVSKNIEETRRLKKYYLTSNVVMMGSLLSEGRHFYLDRTSPYWPEAMRELIRLMKEVKLQHGATYLNLRDFPSHDSEIKDFLIREGFFKVDMPETLQIDDPIHMSLEQFLEGLSNKARYYLRKDVLKNEGNFDVRFISDPAGVTDEQVERWHRLYKNVKDRSFYINTFDLPLKLFRNILKYPGWEVLEIYFNDKLRAELGEHQAIAMAFCYRSGKNNYCPMIIGLDYNYNKNFKLYKQALYQMTRRARELKCKRVYMGMDASIEKKKYGAIAVPISAFLQADDNYNLELISLLDTATTT